MLACGETMTDPITSRIRRPVRRGGVQRYLMLTLLSFAASVAGTRLLLELTGYPQLGSSELHIAHVLWGGLLLFVAALLPLIYANRWVYDVGALLAGLGVGLFIDEVGKFITQTNDYFYPAAAPIIYAFFLLTVLLYFRVRRPLSQDSRAELYRAFESLGEVLDHDLEQAEHEQLRARLARVAQDQQLPGFAKLAGQLVEFLDSDDVRLAPSRMNRVERGVRWVFAQEARWISRFRHKAILGGGLAGLGLLSILRAVGLMFGEGSPERLLEELSTLVTTRRVAGQTGLVLFSVQLALEGSVGLLLALGAVLLLLGRERLGSGLAYFGLLLSLAVVNLLTFYFQQFSTIITATVQLILLLGLIRYRQRFL
jgi:hypothetical protein